MAGERSEASVVALGGTVARSGAALRDSGKVKTAAVSIGGVFGTSSNGMGSISAVETRWCAVAPLCSHLVAFEPQ